MKLGVNSIGNVFYLSKLINALQNVNGVYSLQIKRAYLSVPNSDAEDGYIDVEIKPEDYLKNIQPISGAYKNAIHYFELYPDCYSPPQYQYIFSGGIDEEGNYIVPLKSDLSFW